MAETPGPPTAPRWLRPFSLVAGTLSTGFGIADLIRGNVGTGIALLVLGVLAVLPVLRRRSYLRRNWVAGFSVSPVFGAYVFFAGCGILGVALILLAIIGATHDPALYGTLGVVAAGGALYIILTDRRSGRR
jgi:TM2 domain-containing membrane protein YozV